MTVSKRGVGFSPVHLSAVGSQMSAEQPLTCRVGLSFSILSVAVGISSPAQAAFEEPPLLNVTQTVNESAEIFPSAPSRSDRLSALQEGARNSRQAWNEWEQQQLEKARLEQIQFEQHQQEQALPSQFTEATHYSADGVYLYGQQQMMNQPATTYFVFESQSGNVTGALYMASSSFDCVQGRMTSDNIALNVTNSYSQETYAYAIALNSADTRVASRFNVSAPPNIDGFHQLSVSEQDREILATCQAQF